MHRILAHAKQQDYHTGLIHFQQIEAKVLEDLDYLLRWFCALLTRQLKLKSKLDNYWDEMLGSKMSCTCYIQEQILEQIDPPLEARSRKFCTDKGLNGTLVQLLEKFDL